MPLSIDNAQFDQFVRFAEQAMQAGKAKTIASLGAEGATGLAARDIKPGSGDSVGAWRVSMRSDPMDTGSREGHGQRCRKAHDRRVQAAADQALHRGPAGDQRLPVQPGAPLRRVLTLMRRKK